MLSRVEHGKCFIISGSGLINSSKQNIQKLEKAKAKSLMDWDYFVRT